MSKGFQFPTHIVSFRVPSQYLPASAGGGGGHQQQQWVWLRLPWQRPQHQPLHLQAQCQVLQREGCQGPQVPLPQVEQVGPRHVCVRSAWIDVIELCWLALTEVLTRLTVYMKPLPELIVMQKCFTAPWWCKSVVPDLFSLRPKATSTWDIISCVGLPEMISSTKSFFPSFSLNSPEEIKLFYEKHI